jgi:threonine 3-dehydrogenase
MTTTGTATSAVSLDSVPTTMTALMKTAPRAGAELHEVPVPTIGEHDVLVRVDAASICGTDLHIYNWDPWAANRMTTPIVFGHEFCGTIVRAGSEVTRVGLGDFIAAESHITCGVCHECTAGQLHACRDVAIIGVDRPGAFAQFVAIPEENAWAVSRSIPPEIATIEEPMGNAVHTVSETPIVGAAVAVFGLGPLGLFAIRIAQVYGAARVIGVELSPLRAQLGLRMGAERVLNPKVDDVEAVLLAETGGEGVSVALEMSGSQSALTQALGSLRHGGTVALLGLPSQPLEVNLADDVIFKGATVKGIIGRQIPQTWHQIRGLLEAGVDMSPVITDRLPLSDFQRAFELLAAGRSGKIVLYPNKSPGRR